MAQESDEKPTPKYMKPYLIMEDALCEAAAAGNLGRVARILQERIDPNCRNTVGRAPLHYAAMNGQFEVIRILLCNRAQVYITDANGVTPLHLAARKDHLRCVQLLCFAGADYHKMCASKCTPRDLAPSDSETSYFLERCEIGDKIKAKHVFPNPGKPYVPPWTIPKVQPVDAKASKGKPRK